MRISTVGYSMKQGVKNIWRNKLFSFASIATMSACIFVFGLFFSIIYNFNHIVKLAEEGVAITVFFDEDITEDERDNIEEKLKARDDVKEVNYVSAEKAWEGFQKEYFGESSELAEGLHMAQAPYVQKMALSCINGSRGPWSYEGSTDAPV